MIFPGRSPSRIDIGPAPVAVTPDRPVYLWSATRFGTEAAARSEQEEQSHYVRGQRLPLLIAGGSDIDGDGIPSDRDGGLS